MRVTFRGTALHDIGHLYLADGFEHLSSELLRDPGDASTPAEAVPSLGAHGRRL